MDFTLEELRTLLDEMGFKNVPENHVKIFAKDLSRLMRHERHVQKHNLQASVASSSTATSPNSTDTSRSHQNSTVSKDSFLNQPPVQNKLANPARTQNSYEKSQIPQEIGPPPKPSARRTKSSEAAKARFKRDPVRLYHWYKTNWEHHGLDK